MLNKVVLVVSVHPDDETLACGGTLLKHIANGDKVIWLIVSTISAELGFDSKVIENRSKEIEEVSKLYGFSKTIQLDFLATKLDIYPSSELISSIFSVFDKFKPDTVYLPFRNDVHSDHRICFDAAYSCTKSFRNSSIKKILMMETLSETEFAPSIPSTSFSPTSFVDISDYMNLKLEIMSIYKSELGVHPFPRSVKNLEALAVLRGATAGCDYAESFMLLKEIC